MKGITQLKSVWMWSGGINFQQIWFHDHNISSGFPSWNVFTLLFFNLWCHGYDRPQRPFQDLFWLLFAYFCTHFWENEHPMVLSENTSPVLSVWCTFCSKPTLMPSQMISSRTVHYRLPVGVFLLLVILLFFHVSIILFLNLKNTVKVPVDLCYTHHNQSSSHCTVFLHRIAIPWVCILFCKCQPHQTSNLVILSWIFSKLCFFLRSETVLNKAFQMFCRHIHVFCLYYSAQ